MLVVVLVLYEEGCFGLIVEEDNNGDVISLGVGQVRIMYLPSLFSIVQGVGEASLAAFILLSLSLFP